MFGITGYGWAAMQGLVSGLTMFDVIGDEAGGPMPADGARDILLVGMDSRTDAQGNPLPPKLLAKLRAGTAEGEQNTDTLIYVHIPNNGGKAYAISLPRDSYVPIPGFGEHKINSAYARGKAVARQQMMEEGAEDRREIEVRSDQEGAKTLIKTVENLTGYTIDNYASINLLGFYEITKAIGGVEVCLKEATEDSYSGADFEAGRQTIKGQDALAFVRQRHGLIRGDLDRVVRQQVFMAGLARKVLSAGTLADPAKLNALSEAIKKSVVVNEGWDILSFAQEMRNLVGGNIQFRTIPIVNPEYDTPTDGEAVKVDVEEVRAFVQSLSGKKPSQSNKPAPKPSEITVDVLNGAGIDNLAGSVSESLVQRGFVQGLVGNAEPRQSSVILVPSGEKPAGRAVSDALGGAIPVEVDPSVAAGHVQVELGPDYTPPSEPAAGGGAQPGRPQQAHAPQQSPQQAQQQAPEPDSGKKPITASGGVPCVN